MKRVIFAYGHNILKQKCQDIDKNYPRLENLITDMWKIMKNANGCGLASSQIGIPIKLFIVNSKTTFDNLEEAERKKYFTAGDEGITETFINAQIIERSIETWEDEEGCLSIPGLSQKVTRPWKITVAFCNKDFDLQTRTFSGATARMIQHEFDHTEGVLFVDYLKPLKKKMLEGKLKRIVNGQIETKYPIKFV